MATALTPAPKDIGLASPALGPWYIKPGGTNTADLTLPPPNSALAVPVQMEAGSQWLPPATGLFSLHVASTPRPKPLAGLRIPTGQPAFTNGQIIALFTLLPEVEARLYDLSAAIPSPDGVTSTGAPTRLRIRCLALELPETASTFQGLFDRIPNMQGDTDAARAAYLGLRLVNGVLENTDAPMADLHRPGMLPIVNSPDPILQFKGPQDKPLLLYAFDERGRPVDPGAVAAWWSHLATTAFNNLWAPGNLQRTIGVMPARTIHVVNAHDGVLTGPLLSRATFSNTSGTVPVLTHTTGGAAQIAFSAAPTPDNAPVPRVGLLPHGKFATSLSLWGAANALPRDFVRVALVDLEHHLVGQPRLSAQAATTPAGRRAADQQRASTRVLVAPSTVTPALAGDIEAAAHTLFAAVLPASPPAGASTSMVSAVLDRDWGPFPPLTATTGLPAALPPLSVFPLKGGGEQVQGPTVAGQKVVLRMALGAGLAGAWLRAFPQGFDAQTGRHFAMDGGAGRADAAGNVVLVMTLPDGAVGAARLGVTFVLATSTQFRQYGEQRFARPTPAGGLPVALAAVGSASIVLCEQGQKMLATALNAAVAPGTTLVMETGTGPSLAYTLVDPASLAATHFLPTTVANRLGSGDKIELTQPAFRRVPTGSTAVTLATTGATVHEAPRNGIASLIEPCQPLPGMERLEVACVTVSANAAQAAVLSAPLLSRYHEFLPHQAGHPGAPAGTDMHGTGVSLDNNAAAAVADSVVQRTAKSTKSLVTDATAAPAPPTSPTTPSRWAAVLKTVGAGVEGEIPYFLFKVDLDTFPYDGPYSKVRDWYQTQVLSPLGTNIPFDLGLLPAIPDTDPKASVALRAVSRRILALRYGCREGATSVVAALARAEDFVYIETPALDLLEIGETNDTLGVANTLIQRLLQQPMLCVAICVPLEIMPGYPKTLGEYRDVALLESLAAIREAAGVDRFVLFSPSAGPGRRLHITSTTVIVDDVYALTGTTHLWRRGLSFDSSLAVAVFDEVLQHGRPQDLRDFRRALLGGRLGLPPAGVPDHPHELIDAIRIMAQRGSPRLSTETLVRPKASFSKADHDAWNPNGAVSAQTFNLAQWLITLSVLQGSGEITGDKVQTPVQGMTKHGGSACGPGKRHE